MTETVMSRPQLSALGGTKCFLKFIEWARDHATKDETLRNWNQDMRNNALATEGIHYTKDVPSKNEWKNAFWNVRFRSSAKNDKGERSTNAKRHRPRSDSDDFFKSVRRKGVRPNFYNTFSS